MSGTVPGDLLEILVCPQCKGNLRLQSEGAEHAALDCMSCQLRYLIEDGIPVMLVEEARPLDPPAVHS